MNTPHTGRISTKAFSIEGRSEHGNQIGATPVFREVSNSVRPPAEAAPRYTAPAFQVSSRAINFGHR